MKRCLLVPGILLIFTQFCAAQNPADEARKRMMERNTGNGSSIVAPSQSRNQTIISYITYVTKDREWADVKGRKMTGRLVAFSAPEPGKTGPVVILKDGKVRLRRTGAKVSNDLPLTQLSQADQLFVKAIEAGIKKSAAKP